MVVHLEEINALLARLNEFNSVKLEELELYEGGKKITISPDVYKKWDFMGLTNKFFIELRFWEEPRE